MDATVYALKKSREIVKKILAYARSRNEIPDEDWDELVENCGYVELETRKLEKTNGKNTK